jgi:hypothetical protein
MRLRLKYWRLRWQPRPHGELCMAYGGVGWDVAGSGEMDLVHRPRVCAKDRWHSDSHAYDFVDGVEL